VNVLLFQQVPVPASETSVALPEIRLRKSRLLFEAESTLRSRASRTSRSRVKENWIERGSEESLLDQVPG